LAHASTINETAGKNLRRVILWLYRRKEEMKRSMILTLLILCSAEFGDAATYKWTSDQGVVSYSDNLADVPAKYRHKVIKQEDITTRTPQIREEVRQQEERAQQEEDSHPPIVITPDNVPTSPAPAVAAPTNPESDELPPGRTKSQKIRDNIERRNSGE
jgi:hypothetical protein